MLSRGPSATVQCTSTSKDGCLHSAVTYQEATAACENLDEDGGGWHLCTRAELQSSSCCLPNGTIVTNATRQAMQCFDHEQYVWTRNIKMGRDYLILKMAEARAATVRKELAQQAIKKRPQTGAVCKGQRKKRQRQKLPFASFPGTLCSEWENAGH